MNFSSISYWSSQFLLGLGMLLLIFAKFTWKYALEIYGYVDLRGLEIYFLYIWTNGLGSILFPIGIILALFQILSIEQITKFGRQVSTDGKFGLLILLPMVILSIGTDITYLFNLEPLSYEFHEFSHIFNLVGSIIFILGASIRMYLLKSNSTLETSIRQGFVIITLGVFFLFIDIFNYIIDAYLSQLGSWYFSALVYGLVLGVWTAVIIHTNRLIYRYSLQDFSTQDQKTELYIQNE